MKIRFYREFGFLLLTLFLTEIGSSMITPLLPFLFFSDHSPFFAVNISHDVRAVAYGYATAVIRVGALLASLLLGIAMDFWGRRSVLLLSCLGLFLAMIFLGVSIDRAWFVLFMLGLFFSKLLYAGKQTAQAMIGDQKNPDQKMIQMSFLQGSIAFGACLGPIFGGNLGSLVSKILTFHVSIFLWPFLFAALMTLCGAGVVFFRVPETLPREVKKTEKGFLNFFNCFRSLAVWKVMIPLGLSQLAWGAYYEFSPLWGKLHFNFSSGTLGFFVGSIALWLVLGSALLLPLLRRILSRGMLTQLSGLLLLLGSVLMLIPLKITFWMSAIAMAIGDVMIYSLLASQLSDLISTRYQGRMVGFVYVLATFIWSFVGILGGHLTAWRSEGALYLSLFGALSFCLFEGGRYFRERIRR